MNRSPYPGHWTVRRARDAYLAENGFTVEAYDAKWTDGSVFGIPVKIPNTRHHRWAIMLHDLLHVATGYGTNAVGEGEISAHELRNAVLPLGPYVATIVFFGAILGFCYAPSRIAGAWRDAAKTRTLYELHPVEDKAAYEELLNLTVADLRALLSMPADGLARFPRERHAYAPSAPNVTQDVQHQE
jgi:hypothetical protein